MIVTINESCYAVCRDKKYYETDWQKGRGYDYCQAQLQSGKANGYGIVTGNGYLAIDFDGSSSIALANAIALWINEVDTTKWTSGKTGHYQLLFRIPTPHLPFWSDLTKHDLTTYKKVKCTNNDHLELRYNNHASVLPPSVHPETGYYKWVREVPPHTLTIPQSYDLLNVVTEYRPADITSDAELQMLHEALSFIPSDDYHTWVTVGAGLYRHGIDITVWDNWSATSAKYDGKGIDKKWQSFNGISNITIGTVFYLAKQHGFDQSQWMRQHLKGTRHTLNRTLHNDSSSPNNNTVALTQQLVEELALPHHPPDYIDLQVAVFCHTHKVASAPIYRAIASRLARLYEEEALETAQDMADVPSMTLNLPYLIGDFLGELFTEQANRIPSTPEALFTCFMPQITALIGTKQRIIANPSSGFRVPYILRTAIIADSGSAKSAVLNNACLGIMDINKRNLADYYRAREMWEAEGKKGKPPHKNQILFKEFSFEGLYKELTANGHGSGLVLRDELKGYFNMVGNNKYGQGDNAQRDLELFEGDSIVKTRQGDDYTVYIPDNAVSFTGCLQWQTVQSIFNHADDESGISPRWLFYCGNLPEYRLMDWSDNTDWQEMITVLAQSVSEAVLPRELLFSGDAYKHLQHWFNDTMRVHRTTVNYLQEKSKHNKILSDCIKFCGLLYNLHQHLGTGVAQGDVIEKDIVERACYLSEFYVKHYSYAFLRCQDDLLTTQLQKVLDVVNRKGREITAVEVRNALGGGKCKLTAQDIGKLLCQLVTLGKLTRVTTKKGVRVAPLP